jgi:hypothetical protein
MQFTTFHTLEPADIVVLGCGLGFTIKYLWIGPLYMQCLFGTCFRETATFNNSSHFAGCARNALRLSK